MSRPFFAALLLTCCQSAMAQVEQRLNGLVDLRWSHTDAAGSYLDGDYGKFANGEGGELDLSHAALTWRAQWRSGLAVFVAAHSYGDAAGITEAYLHYRGLPSPAGLRLEGRAGLIYPRVSLENPLTAWTSPYTLDFSTINSWIAEEVRHRGAEITVTRLGKFSGSTHDLSVSAALLRGNDPTGAMLAWHGWVIGNRQSLQNERLALPRIDAGFVPESSDAFIELDGRTGWHLNLDWEYEGGLRLLLGRYDNRADPRVVKNLQWAWTTRFSHLGLHWKLGPGLDLLGQYVDGDTLMRTSNGAADLVNNDFRSGWLMISKAVGRHRFSGRLEEFSVTDRDHFPSDNNDEYGKALTLSYRLQLDRNWSLQAEYTLTRGQRLSRPPEQGGPGWREDQWQLALRYFF